MAHPPKEIPPLVVAALMGLACTIPTLVASPIGTPSEVKPTSRLEDAPSSATLSPTMGPSSSGTEGYAATQPSEPCTGEPRLFPSSNPILFVANRDGDPEIYSVNPDGGDLRQLTSNQLIDASPSWSPDAKTLAFASEKEGSGFGIIIADAGGSSPRNVLPDDYSLGISPPPYLEPSEEGEDTPIAFPGDPGLAGQPWFEWSPDGKVMVARVVGGVAGPLALVTLGTSEVSDLVGPAFSDGPSFSWSPDSRFIAAEHQLDSRGVAWAILTVQVSSGRVSEILPVAVQERSPRWEPSGQGFLYIARDFETGASQLMEFRAEDGTRRQVTSSEPAKIWAEWSPNGQLIALSESTITTDAPDASIAIQIINVADGTMRTLASGPGVDPFHFTWAPDGVHLAYIDESQGISSLFAGNVCDGRIVLVAEGVARDRLSWRP